MEEVIRMLNEESRRKIRELKIDELVDILDDQEHRLDVYAPMSFDDRLSLAIDELYYRKNSKRAKRLISSAKLRYPDADINTLILEPRGLSNLSLRRIPVYISIDPSPLRDGFMSLSHLYRNNPFSRRMCIVINKQKSF